MDWLWQIFDPAYIGAFFTQFKNEMATPTFWVAVGKIIWINVLLSGDNALVIALACRGGAENHAPQALARQCCCASSSPASSPA